MELEGNLKDAREGEVKKSKKHVGEFGALLVESEPSARRSAGNPEYAGRGAIEKLAAPEAEQPTENRSLEKLRSKLEGKRIETISRADLLAISEQVTIDGSTLRQVFETHLIGEQGLRRLVAEYLRGGDLKAALSREVLERELDFERDPALRDLNSIHDTLAAGNTAMQSKATLSKLLEQAAASVSDSSDEAAFFKAQADYEADQHQQLLKHHRFLDIALLGTITVLAVLVIIMYLSRH